MSVQRPQREYVVGDATEVLDSSLDAAVIHLDDAWARPHRCDGNSNNVLGVKYPTHSFETTKKVLDSCYEALEEGGWLIMDVDDWLLPKAISYIKETWGDVNAPPAYSGGGYRKSGRVVYVTADGSVNRSGTAKYLRQSGYPVIFAHKGETDRSTYESAVQLCRDRRADYGWGSVKRLSPYETWIDSLTEEGDLIVSPYAGTEPARTVEEKL